MKIVVPLAGPDFLTAEFGIRPLYEMDGEPLMRRVLRTRPWWGATRTADLCVVVRATPRTAEFRTWLETEFPGLRIVELPGPTQGAMQSVLAGVAAVVENPAEPLCVDLADILFDAKWPVIADSLARASAVAPYFDSDDPNYSYLELGPGDVVVRTAEKDVISRHASAGVYLFSNAGAFFTAAEYAHQAWACGTARALFVCPSLNGLIRRNERVLGVEVSGVRPIGTLFHRDDLSD